MADPLTLLAAGGRGGNGGDGGNGGAGGDGGDPAPGFRSVTGQVPAGRPGRGGRGGDGGNGGRGGNGGICSNVFVTLPERMTGQLRVVTCPAAGGTGGAGGADGLPGRGGKGGDGENDGDPAAVAGHPGEASGAGRANGGASAAGGVAGKAGRDGVRRPTPAVFVNGKPFIGSGQPVSVSKILSSLGVPEGAASGGTRIGLHNVTQLRDLLDIGLPPEQRAQHAEALLDGTTAPAGPGRPGSRHHQQRASAP